jgi:hypothetical protein
MNVPLFNELDIGKALAKGCRIENASRATRAAKRPLRHRVA